MNIILGFVETPKLIYGAIRLVLRKIVGWVERSETQRSLGNVGFRSSTQPTLVLVSPLNNNGIDLWGNNYVSAAPVVRGITNYELRITNYK